MRVAVVGAGSFIGKALRSCAGAASWRFMSHHEAFKGTDWLEDIDVLLNCAFNPRLKNEPYESTLDIDLQLARLLQDRPSVRYVMLSSRMAYGSAAGTSRLSEEQEARPVRPYGVAKLLIEQNLRQLLGDRLTVLRLSNVFGAEFLPGRQSFMAIALRKLREEGQIVLDISPFVERDFVPVEDLTESLLQVVKTLQPGVFNLGSGHGTPTGRIAQWLIEGYGRGRLLVTDVREHDPFWLDITAARRAFGIQPVTAERIRARCLLLGKSLHDVAD